MTDFSKDYNSGYGQARADALLRISEAMQYVASSMGGAESEEEELELRSRHLALQWVRALIKTSRPSARHQRRFEEDHGGLAGKSE